MAVEVKGRVRALESDYEKAEAILRAAFANGRMSRPQVGFVKGTLTRLFKSLKERPLDGQS